MRVTYNREMKLKKYLDDLSIENFVPMHYDLVDTDNERKRILVPAIHNLIFVHTTQSTLTNLKMTNPLFEPLRYMMKPSHEGLQQKEVIFVPDHQMENFMRVASVQDDSVTFLECRDFITKIGKPVRITAGPFNGVEGVIKRIKKNKYVVVQIEGVAAVAVTYVPSDSLVAI